MRKLSILFIAVFFAATAGAQIGVKLGANFAGMSSSTSVDGSKMAIAFHGGVVYEKGILPLGLLKLRTELLYSVQGFDVYNEQTVGGVDMIGDMKYRLNYFRLPILAKVKLGPLYAMAGPYFGYALSGSTYKKATVDGKVVSEETQDMKLSEDDSFNRLDIGVDAGLGMQFGIPAIPFKMFVEARAGIGLSNLMVTDTDEYMKNMVIAVSLGVLFGK